MKKFLIQTICLGAFVLLLLYIIQFGIDKKARQIYSTLPYRTLNMVREPHAIDADVVVFGNSRARCHYHSELIDSILDIKCYNLGLAGYPFDYTYNFVIAPYLEHNISPKLCIVEVGPQAFLGYWNSNYATFFLPYINEKYSRFYFDICDKINILHLFLPIKYYGTMQTLRELEICNTTATLEYKDAFKTRSAGNYRVNFPDIHYNVEHNDTIIQYFKHFVNNCRKKGVPLLFVCSPMHKNDFYDHCEMEQFWNLIDSVAPDVPILDYSLMFGNDTTYFGESTHMNTLGADSFSIKLAHDIDSIGFLR